MRTLPGRRPAGRHGNAAVPAAGGLPHTSPRPDAAARGQGTVLSRGAAVDGGQWVPRVLARGGASGQGEAACLAVQVERTVGVGARHVAAGAGAGEGGGAVRAVRAGWAASGVVLLHSRSRAWCVRSAWWHGCVQCNDGA